MPTIEYKCENCGHPFKMVVFRGDKETEARCPKCNSPRTKSLPKSESVFNGISNFSTFLKDTN
jgi:putative FmdB family regulatory protein